MNDGESPESFEARRQRNRAKGYNGNGQGTPLAMAARMWPTATAQDAASTAARNYSTESGRHSGTTLTDATRNWATQNARAHKGMDLPSRNGGTSLAEQTERGRFSHRVQSTHDGRELSPTGRTLRPRLNPVFGCWLMGWPSWWTNVGPTACARSEMASYLSRLRSLCEIFCADWECSEVAA